MSALGLHFCPKAGITAPNTSWELEKQVRGRFRVAAVAQRCFSFQLKSSSFQNSSSVGLCETWFPKRLQVLSENPDSHVGFRFDHFSIVVCYTEGVVK